MTQEQVERMDEELLLQGFDWREAASITNEAVHPYYSVVSRAQLAIDIRKAQLRKMNREGMGQHR
jgi:hypothetical protein